MENLFQQALDMVSGSNTILWLVISVAALVLTVVIKFILNLTSARLRTFTQRTHSIWDDIGLDLLDGLKGSILFVWIFFLMTRSLEQNNFVKHVLPFVLVISAVFQVGIWGLYLIKNWRTNILDRRIRDNPSSAAALGLLYTALQIVFISLLVLAGLSNLGIDVTALIAGLGVGGIAIALAAQNILGDLLASLSIVLDKPFVVGDFIVTGNEKGTIEYVGVKTTRLRSLSGEQLVMSNKDILESRIQNFKRMDVRRVVQKFGVLYSTPVEKLEKIPQWTKEIIIGNEKLKFDRCHFFSYGDSSLDFEFVFFVKDPDYNTYMDLQQMVLLDIFRKFQEEKVDFAFPTRTIHVESLPSPKAETEHPRIQG